MEACCLISSIGQKAIHALENFHTSMDSFESFLAVGAYVSRKCLFRRILHKNNIFACALRAFSWRKGHVEVRMLKEEYMVNIYLGATAKVSDMPQVEKVVPCAVAPTRWAPICVLGIGLISFSCRAPGYFEREVWTGRGWSLTLRKAFADSDGQPCAVPFFSLKVRNGSVGAQNGLERFCCSRAQVFAWAGPTWRLTISQFFFAGCTAICSHRGPGHFLGQAALFASYN